MRTEGGRAVFVYLFPGAVAGSASALVQLLSACHATAARVSNQAFIFLL